MIIYYIGNKNYVYTDSENELINNLKTTNTLYPIKIVKCSESRYLCKKKRIAKISRVLRKSPYKSKVIFVNLLHVGKSYEEIHSVIDKNYWNDFFYIYSADKESIPFCDSVIKGNEVWCNLTTRSISTDKESFKKYIRELIISHGIKKSKKKMKGRAKGSINKHSDYDPYKEKILEGLERKMSIRRIVHYIDFGTKSGLEYYIKHRLEQ